MFEQRNQSLPVDAGRTIPQFSMSYQISYSGSVHQASPAHRIDLIAQAEEHDVSVTERTEIRTVAVVTLFLTAFHGVMGRGEICQETRGVLVTGVAEVPAVEDADDSEPQIVDPGVQVKPLVRPVFLHSVVYVGIAGKPPPVRKIRPALQSEVQIHAAVFIALRCFSEWDILRPSLHENLDLSPGYLDAEFPIGIEKRMFGTYLEYTSLRIGKHSSRSLDVYLCGDGFSAYFIRDKTG